MLYLITLVFWGELEFVSSVKLKTDEFFAYTSSCAVMSDENIYAIASDGGSGHCLLRVDGTGNIVGRYSETGQGPGEFVEPSNVCIVGDKVIVGETLISKIHVFSKDLTFLKDYRTDTGGKVFHLGEQRIGIWSPHGVSGDGFLYQVFDLEKHESLGNFYRFDGNDAPKFVQYWGGLTFSNNENSVYSAYVHTRMIHKLNLSDMKETTFSIKNVKHFESYFPYKQKPDEVLSSKDIQRYIDSWTIVYGIHVLNDKLLVEHRLGGQKYVDVLRLDGSLIQAKIPIDTSIQSVVGDHIWFVLFEEADDTNNFYFKKARYRE